MKYADKPTVPEAAPERRRTDALLAAAKWGEGWGEIEDAGGGRVKRTHGMYRIEGCASGNFAVLYHDDRVVSGPVPLKMAIALAEGAEKDRVKDAAETATKHRKIIAESKAPDKAPETATKQARSPIKTAKGK